MIALEHLSEWVSRGGWRLLAVTFVVVMMLRIIFRRGPGPKIPPPPIVPSFSEPDEPLVKCMRCGQYVPESETDVEEPGGIFGYGDLHTCHSCKYIEAEEDP